MTAARRTRENVLLLAGGVGITPMRALFASLPLAPGQDLLLQYVARSEADLLFREELDHLAAASGGRVQYLVGDGAGPLSAALLTRLVPDLAARDVYFCGPPGMGVGVGKALRESGLPVDHVHEERFAW